MNNSESCDQCLFWLSAEEADSLSINVMRGLGLCRRFPPTVVANPRFNEPNNQIVFDSSQPETFPEDWCGEFRKRAVSDG